MDNQVLVPSVLTRNYAFLFDLDGTLADIQPHLDQVVIPNNALQVPNALAQQWGGAVTLISERSMAELDTLTHPWRLPLAGVRGVERRDTSGKIYIISLPPALHGEIATELTSVLQRLPGCELGNKEMAFTPHYRQAPQQQSAALKLAQRIVQRYPLLTLQLGKCVVEIEPHGVNKGEAINAFMQEMPFAGREPVLVGDDLTDGAGFSVVNQLQGMPVRVGAGETQAHWRSADAAAVRTWLQHSAYDA